MANTITKTTAEADIHLHLTMPMQNTQQHATTDERRREIENGSIEYERVCVSAAEELERIDASPMLTPVGRHDARDQVFRRVEDRFLTLKQRFRAPVQAQIDAAVARAVTARTPPAAEERLRLELRAREIRDHYRGMELLERDFAAQQAAREGNQEVYEALVFAPMPLLSGTGRTQAEALWVERQTSGVEPLRVERNFYEYAEQSVRLTLGMAPAAAAPVATV